ncbi:cytochrome P450 [Aspergillus undulatus]|uniref:cytochrome P450 n=1 Tax=Aspergillus undulatus TaxID=1810928 RepID=UPI003CCCDC94
MPPLNLVEVDSLEAHVLIDNELDPMSTIAPDTVQVSGMMYHLAMGSPHHLDDRGDAHKELQMEDICCSAHGLSILLTATKGDQKHSVLFDAGPEEEAWQRNVRRMRPDLSSVELVQLSHWHRDHSGGLLRAVRMISDAKEASGRPGALIADLHPNRPDFRGFSIGENIISFQADPSFEELEAAGATIQKHEDAHTVLDGFFLISGEIPRRTPYETGLKHGMRFDKNDNEWTSDETIADERFIMCNVKDKGIVMLTGCSHAGVVNCTQHALELAGGSVPLHAVIGGFHLATSDAKQIDTSIRDLLKLDPAVLLPGHCTGWRAKFAIEKRQPGMLVPCSVGPIRIFLHDRRIHQKGGAHAPTGPRDIISAARFFFAVIKAQKEHRLHEFFNECFEHGNPSSPNCVESNLFGSFRVIQTREPDHLKAVLTGKFADFGKGELFHKLWIPFLGDSIFTTDGKEWQGSRNLIRPMFIKDRISDLDIFERKVQTMLSLYSPSGEPTDVMDLFYRMTLDAITEFLLGKGINSLGNPQADFALAFAEVQRIQTMLTMIGPAQVFYPRAKYNEGLKVINDFVWPFVHEVLNLQAHDLEKSTALEKSFTFLHALANYTRNPKTIRDQVVSVLLAGRDTTAATLSWTFYELSHYPETYSKLRAEVLNKVGPSRTPTYDDLKNMPYLRHTINEALRLYPAVPYNIRFALKDTTLPTGGGPNGDLPITVLKGDAVAYSTYAMQRRADLYPPVSEKFLDPSIFSPERWEVWSPRPWHYIPFNGGPRICIGQNFALAEMGYTIVRILQRYERVEYVGEWERQFHKSEIVGTPGMGVRLRMFEAGS